MIAYRDSQLYYFTPCRVQPAQDLGRGKMPKQLLFQKNPGTYVAPGPNM